MRPLLRFVQFALVVIIICSCKSSSDSSIHFYVGNLSRLQKEVDIHISMGGKPMFDSSVKLTSREPYAYIADKKIQKGTYNIDVMADSGRLKLVQPVTVNDDLWVYVSYTFGSTGDSLFQPSTLKERPSLAAIDHSKSNPSLHIFVSDSKPASFQPDTRFKKWAEDTSSVQ